MRLDAGRLVLGALGLTLLAVTLVGPWPATRGKRPDLFERNLESVLEDAHHASRGLGPLRFAFAKREITPQPGEPLAGYGDRWLHRKTCTGSTHPLWCRALALGAGDEVVCIVGLDLLCLTRDARDRALAALAARSKLPASRVLFSATHTHSGPGGYSPELVARAFLGAPCASSRDRIVQAIAESVDEATKPLLAGEGATGSLNVSRVELPALVRNRLLGTDEPVDAALTCLELVADAGAPAPREVRCVSFGAHATLLGPDNLEADGDYPGAVVRELESEATTGHEPANREGLFLAGAVGSQSPRRPPGRGEVEAYGHEVFFSPYLGVAPRSANTTSRLIELRAFETEIELPPASPRIGRLRVSPLLAATQVGSRASLRFVRVGSLAIVAAPGDLSGELSLRAKKEVEQEGRVLLPISFSGDYHGYLLPEERADLEGYEPAMMWHGPEGGEMVLAALVAGARALFE